MTNEAWLEASTNVSRGIRNMPVVKDHPEKFCLLSMDGYKSHQNSPEALSHFVKAKIHVIKEESHTSHINQPYDKFVAKSDKKQWKKNLDIIRQNGTVVDQLTMVAAVIGILNDSKSQWEQSFKAVNMHPDKRISFEEWMKKCDRNIAAGGMVKKSSTEENKKVLYSALPELWRCMGKTLQSNLINVIKAYERDFSIACAERLIEVSEGVLNLGTVRYVQTAYFAVQNYPWMIEYDELEEPINIREISDKSYKGGESALNANAECYQLKPEGLKGKSLFEHMCNFRSRVHDKPNIVSDYIDVEVSDDNQKVLAPSRDDLMFHSIMKETIGEGAKKKMIQRHLNVAGELTSHCALLSCPKYIMRLRQHEKLLMSLSSIQEARQSEKAAKAADNHTSLLELAPTALLKYKAKMFDSKKLSKLELCAIACKYFDTKLQLSLSKGALVTVFDSKVAASKHLIESAVKNISTSAEADADEDSDALRHEDSDASCDGDSDASCDEDNDAASDEDSDVASDEDCLVASDENSEENDNSSNISEYEDRFTKKRTKLSFSGRRLTKKKRFEIEG